MSLLPTCPICRGSEFGGILRSGRICEYHRKKAMGGGSVAGDKLETCFFLQEQFMRMLVEHDKMPEYPVDLTTKPGQRVVKECIFNLVEELMEASFTLKNRMHKLSDDKDFDRAHYVEELGDAFAYFIEACHLSGISSQEIFEEYKRKNQIVRKRLEEGY